MGVGERIRGLQGVTSGASEDHCVQKLTDGRGGGQGSGPAVGRPQGRLCRERPAPSALEGAVGGRFPVESCLPCYVFLLQSLVWKGVASEVCVPHHCRPLLSPMFRRGSSNLDDEHSPLLRRLTWNTAARLTKAPREYSSGYSTTQADVTEITAEFAIARGQSSKCRAFVLASAIIISRAPVVKSSVNLSITLSTNPIGQIYLALLNLDCVQWYAALAVARSWRMHGCLRTRTFWQRPSRRTRLSTTS